MGMDLPSITFLKTQRAPCCLGKGSSVNPHPSLDLGAEVRAVGLSPAAQVRIWEGWTFTDTLACVKSLSRSSHFGGDQDQPLKHACPLGAWKEDRAQAVIFLLSFSELTLIIIKMKNKWSEVWLSNF